MIRRTWIVAAMIGVLTVVVGATASADSVDVGTVNFDSFIPDAPGSAGVNTFDISNFTGDPNTGGNAFPPFFPVLTFMNFNDLSLSVTESDGTVLAPISLGTAGPGDTYFNDANFVDTLGFSSATLMGEFSPTSVTLSDGTTVTVGGDFSATILPSAGDALTASTDYAVIVAQTEVVAAPESSSVVLFSCGAFLLLGLVGGRFVNSKLFNH